MRADPYYFHRVGAPRLAEGLADREHDVVAFLHHAALQELVLRHRERSLAVAGPLEIDGIYAVVERHPPARFDDGAHGVDRHARVHARHQEHGLAALRELSLIHISEPTRL